MIIIGEKINGSIPIVAEAIAKRDSEFIKARAKLQAELLILTVALLFRKRKKWKH